jgi:glycosyltransferase involved in cell wall biosynthesis
MRVVLDATALGSGLGGDETYLSGMLEGLAAVARDDDVFPLLTRPGASLPAGLDAARFPTRTVKRAPGAVHYAAGLRAALRSERGRADLVHTITHAPIASPVPVALTVGDLSFRHHPEHFPRAARARLNVLVPWQCRTARVVCAPSEFSRRDLIDSYDLDPERVVVVPNRVPSHTPLTEAQRAAAHARLALHGVGDAYVLYLGNLHPRKNVARLIEAYDLVLQRDALLRHVQLVVAGGRWWKGGPEEAAAACARHGDVVMLGRVDADVRGLLLEDALALAYVSIFEGFGLPPIEAMAAGTPVLASNVTAVPEVCGDAALLVDPLDVDAIAAGLHEVLTDGARRAGLVSRGRQRAALFDVAHTGAAAYAAFVRATSGAASAAPQEAGGMTAEHTLGPATGGM